MPVTLERAPYGGWDDAVHLRNDRLHLVASTGFGPRILHLGAPGERNLFWLDPAWRGRIADDATDGWVNYGGHRLWHAPEVDPRTYQPDNAPIDVEALRGDERSRGADGASDSETADGDPGGGAGVRLRAPVETTTGIAKTVEIRLDAEAPRATVRHRLENVGPWPIDVAPWALSVMAPGGTAIVPLPPRGPFGPDGLLPTGRLVLWRYTDLSDPRWRFGRRFVLLQHGDGPPQKAGYAVPDGWAAYAIDGALFVKRFAFDPEARYPDAGSSVETYTDASFLELETLGPLSTLAPGATVEHVETWELHEDVPVPRSDDDVTRDVLPRIG